MTENTILGPPASESRSERMVADAATDAVPVDDGEGTGGTVPGNATTAFHRGRLYSVLAIGFDRPGEALQRAVDHDAFGADLHEAAAATHEDVAELVRPVESAVADATDLEAAWVSLFGVEEGVTVSPYELTYLPGPLVTNVRKLADLGGFYEAFELAVAPGKNDRLDHLCFLLEFLGQLSFREAYLRLEVDADGVAVVGDAYRQFVESHLGRWYWRFADEVRRRDEGFYAALAELLVGLLEEEIDRLGVDPDPVPDDPTVAEWTEDIFGDSGRGCGGCGITPPETGNQDLPPVGPSNWPDQPSEP